MRANARRIATTRARCVGDDARETHHCNNAFQFTEDGGVCDASRDVIARAG